MNPRAFTLVLALASISAGAGANDGPPAAARDYPHEFVSANQGRYEAYLAELQALWQQCCADQERSYASVAAPACPDGDLFDTGGTWFVGDLKQRPIDAGLKQLFDTEIDSYRVCEIPGEDGKCLLWGTRWNLRAQGKGKIGGGAVTLDGNRCSLTLNAVKFDYEGYGKVVFKQLTPDLRSSSVTGSGQPLKVKASVIGPAEMSRYGTAWSVRNGSLQGGGFARDGKLWTAVASLTVPGAMAMVELDALLGDKRYGLGHIGISGHPPPLDGIQLRRAGRDILLDQPLHLFYPSDGAASALTLSAEARLTNGQRVATWAAPGIGEPRFIVEDEGIASFSAPAGLSEGVYYLAPRRYGETRLMVEYPESIAFARDRTFYEMYPVRVLELTLAKVFDAAGKSRLRLLARGPDPGANRVRWDGPAAGTTAFVKEQGYWLAELPGEGVGRIQVVDPSGLELAMLDVAKRAPAEAAAIRLLPPPAPNYTVFKEMAMPSSNIDLAGWAISSGFCAQAGASKLPQAMTGGKNTEQLQGLLDQARYLCRNQEQLRQNQQEIRRIVPEINRLVRELAHGGSELIGLEDDSIAVGAGIKGLSPRWLDRAYCRWSLLGGGASRLAFAYTPALAVDESNGGCFNRVTNLIEGYQPGMKVAVELVVGL